jgi:hypothetical protein
MKWLSKHHHKADKATKFGYLQGMLQLQPCYNVKGLWGSKTTCDFAGECKKSCLAECGYNSKVLNAKALPCRVKRTQALAKEPILSLSQIIAEIKALEATANLLKLKSVIRPNCTSDLMWPACLFNFCPNVQFIDYTKNPEKLFMSHIPENYFLTYSYNEETPAGLVARVYNETRFNVSVVFDSKVLPKKYTIDDIPYKVIDGDLNDLRFLDTPGCLVGLRFKTPLVAGGFKRSRKFNNWVILPG